MTKSGQPNRAPVLLTKKERERQKKREALAQKKMKANLKRLRKNNTQIKKKKK